MWSLFRKKPPRDPAARARITGYVLGSIGEEPQVSLTISEIDCGDIACPGLETIILILREGEATRAVKVKKPMVEVQEADVTAALKGP